MRKNQSLRDAGFVQRVRSFASDAKGNVAIIFALTAIPVILLMGGAVDIGVYATSQSRLRAATESAALAAASLRASTDVEKTVKAYIKANLPDTEFWEDLIVEVPEPSVSIGSRKITVLASMEMETGFLKLGGINTLTVNSTSVAEQATRDIEISMVLDISSSMSGSKLTNLKSAAGEFVDQVMNDELLGTTMINLVPFGGTVNVGKDIYEDYAVSDKDKNTIENPSTKEYKVGSKIPEGKFLFNKKNYEGDYCFELTSEDFSEDTIPEASRSQVPDFTKWNKNNPWCPPAASAAIFNEGDSNTLENAIDGMVLSDGTGMDLGAAWGLKALSPNWRGKLGGDFKDRPADYDNVDTMKIMIVMSDGDITAQYRPIDYKIDLDSRNTNKNEQTMVSRGNENSKLTDERATAYFKRVCEDAREQDITVYTIGFQIKENSMADTLLKACATNPSNYYWVETVDIEEAFRAIAASISDLRVTG